MKKNNFVIGIPAILLVFGLALSGCGGDGGGNGGGDDLPAASGVNALSGKTYFQEYYGEYPKTTFSTTAEGAQNGTYTVSTVANGTYTANDKFTYTDIETGTYTWNEAAKTVSLKPERIAFSGSDSASSSVPVGSVTIDDEYGPLQDKAEYRAAILSMFSKYTDSEFTDEEGMSKAEYADLWVAEEFGNRKSDYAFSADNAALFLDEALPANKGSNELSGKTFTDEYNSDKTFVFTATAYTVTTNGSESETGTYAYDTTNVNADGGKRVYFRPTTLNGKDKPAYYAALTNTSAGNYATAADANAVTTNDRFRTKYYRYNLAAKTID